MVKLMRGLVPKSVPNFTTSDHVVLGAAIDSHGRCIIIINIAASSNGGAKQSRAGHGLHSACATIKSQQPVALMQHTKFG